MKSLMRWMPSGFDRCVMSTITSALDTTRSVPPSAMIAATPPSDAPTTTGGSPELVGHRDRVGRERGERVVAVERPFAVAVAAQVERHRAPPVRRERRRRAAPRVTGLATAVHEQHGPVVGVAADIGHEVNALESLEAGQRRWCRHLRILCTYPPACTRASVPSPDVAEHTEVRVGTKFLKAAQWAADRHVEYAGDLPGIPTVAQVLGLATLVLEDGGREREAIAAMLLDALADDVPRKESAQRVRQEDDAARGRDARSAGHDRARTRPARRRAVARHAPTPRSTSPSPRLIPRRCASAPRACCRRRARCSGSCAATARSRSCAAPRRRPSISATCTNSSTVLSRRRPRTLLTQELRAAAADVDRLSELETATLAWRVTHARFGSYRRRVELSTS